MARPEIIVLKHYRQNFGDVDVPDVPLFGDRLEEAKNAACDSLLGYYKSGPFSIW